MILADLRSYLQTRRQASLQELCLHFQVDADALRGMLGKWMAKGRIRRLQPENPACGSGCCQCDPLLTEIYEWREHP